MSETPVAAESISSPSKVSLYPVPFATLMKGRLKRKLGDFFGLSNFGVNLTRLEPDAISALLHHHSKQDEFIYILQGTPTLVIGDQEYLMQAGDCFGCKAGAGVACQVVNHSNDQVVFLEIGDRTTGDEVEYPNDDLAARQLANGTWLFTHKDGRPY